MNWSGGKDSALALDRVLLADKFDVEYLVTSVNEHWQRISMHGVRRELLHRQAEAIGIPFVEILLPEMPSMEVYESAMNTVLRPLVAEGVTHSIFGDIFLTDLRIYREEQLKKVGLIGEFPLWQEPTDALLNEFFERGFKAKTVCVDAEKLDESYCGRDIDTKFIGDLPTGVDVCGENGEYHSFVFDAPFFDHPLEIEIGETIYREYPSHEASNQMSGFYYCDILPSHGN